MATYWHELVLTIGIDIHDVGRNPFAPAETCDINHPARLGHQNKILIIKSLVPFQYVEIARL